MVRWIPPAIGNLYFVTGKGAELYSGWIEFVFAEFYAIFCKTEKHALMECNGRKRQNKK